MWKDIYIYWEMMTMMSHHQNRTIPFDFWPLLKHQGAFHLTAEYAGSLVWSVKSSTNKQGSLDWFKGIITGNPWFPVDVPANQSNERREAPTTSTQARGQRSAARSASAQLAFIAEAHWKALRATERERYIYIFVHNIYIHTCIYKSSTVNICICIIYICVYVYLAVLHWLFPIFHLPQLFLCNFRCSSVFPTTGWQTSKGKSCTGGSGAKARGNNLSLPLKGSHSFERILSSKPWYSGECTNDKMIQNVENGCSSPLAIAN